MGPKKSVFFADIKWQRVLLFVIGSILLFFAATVLLYMEFIFGSLVDGLQTLEEYPLDSAMRASARVNFILFN